jgi:tryptophan-rich sensory protein
MGDWDSHSVRYLRDASYYFWGAIAGWISWEKERKEQKTRKRIIVFVALELNLSLPNNFFFRLVIATFAVIFPL